MLTAQAPANAAGVPPMQSEPASRQSIDLLRANTIVATSPDKI
jgi:hypothetical protein